MHGKIVNGVLYKQEKEKDRLKICDGWTINLDEIENKEIHSFCYLTEIGRYIISKIIAEKVGFKRPFKTDGTTEKKLCVSVKYWGFIPKGE